jgi:hypothetical protein
MYLALLADTLPTFYAAKVKQTGSETNYIPISCRNTRMSCLTALRVALFSVKQSDQGDNVYAQ